MALFDTQSVKTLGRRRERVRNAFDCAVTGDSLQQLPDKVTEGVFVLHSVDPAGNRLKGKGKFCWAQGSDHDQRRAGPCGEDRISRTATVAGEYDDIAKAAHAR